VRASLGFLLAALALPPAALAQDADVDPNPDPEPSLEGPHDPFGLGVKKLAYSTGLKIAEVFDDNILLAPGDPESDRITVILLKARLRWESGRESAHVNYRGRERLFADHTEFNGMEHFLDAAGSVGVSSFRFEAGLEWKELKDPFDVLQVTGPVDSRYDREYLRAVADFNRFDAEVTAARARFAIDDAALARGDYLRRELSALAAVEVGPQVALFAEVRLLSSDYDEPAFSDFTYTRVVGGIRGSLSPKVHTEARLGFGQADPDSGGLLPAEKFTGVVAAISGVWEIGEKHDLRVELAREPMESVLSGLAIADGIKLRYRRPLAEGWSAQGLLSWDRRQESDGSIDRRVITAGVGVQWAFRERFHADFGALYRTADADVGALEFENFRFSLGLGVDW
jgi:hypothetical protein